MRVVAFLTILAALWAQPARAYVVSGVPFSGSLPEWQQSFDLFFGEGGKYQIDIAFSHPVSITGLNQYQEAYSAPCTPDCDWTGDASISEEDFPQFQFDGTNLSFLVSYGHDGSEPIDGGVYQTIYHLRTVGISLDGNSVPVSFTGLATLLPEPNTWAMLILGVAVTGGALRKRRYAANGQLPLT